MKTLNNIQKTGNIKNLSMKTFAFLTSMAMLCFIFPAKANNSQMPGAANNHFASNTEMVVMPSVTNAANLSVPLMETAAEESLEIENWMMNEYLFTPSAVSETEDPMKIEAWMINAENFRQTTFTEESDQALEVEEWMLAENTWGK